MEFLNVEKIKQKIDSKVQFGDFTTLASILECRRFTAHKKYSRCNKDAVLAMNEIIKNRNRLVKRLQQKHSTKKKGAIA